MKTRTLIAVLVILGLLLPLRLEAVAWKLSRSFWTDEDEKAYGSFVEKICDSKHSNLNRFIRDPKANPLYGEEDKKFNLYADCADLPYLIRSYVAYKLRLPFSYVSAVAGKGGDQRYSRGNRPTEFKDQDYFSSPQKLFGQVTLINSGFYRMAAATENSDHYPVKIQKDSIRPGTIYYDPDGHVAIVAKVMPDGRIRLIDAHPDRSISKPWFGAKFTRGSDQNGGGFKRWRPIRYTSEGKILRSSNHNISDFSAVDQFLASYSLGNRKGLSYYDYVRNRLTDSSYQQNPLSEFATMMSDLYEDILYRAVAVNICIEKGIDKKPHPGSLPWNIFGTDGLWEEFSTPSRDARLKVAFRDFYERTRNLVLQQNQVEPNQAQQLAAAMLQHYHAVSPKFSVNYTDSTGKIRILSFDDVCIRLFKLSFDPYHSIEYRWGADEDELALSPDNQAKKRFYELEYRLRHQLERVYNQATPLSMGPEKPVEVSVKNWLQAFLQGQIIYDQVEKGLVCADASFPPGMSPAEIQLRKQQMVELPELIASNPHELNTDKAAETSMEKVETISLDHERSDDSIARFAGEMLSALDLVAAQIMHLPANSNEK
ncbi:MAG: hypothetical protein AB1403_15465 [Candidatus Riflebacteria bacterium]